MDDTMSADDPGRMEVSCIISQLNDSQKRGLRIASRGGRIHPSTAKVLCRFGLIRDHSNVQWRDWRLATLGERVLEQLKNLGEI